jgi:predicted component of type VI protein secretion system
MRRNDTQMLQTDAGIVTREVEVLAQRLREDVATMKNDVTLDMNNRKNETQEEQKAIDMKIQEINNKFTVQMGEVRTELEAVRWETIWKGMGKRMSVAKWTLLMPFFFFFFFLGDSGNCRGRIGDRHAWLFIDSIC